MRGYNIDPVLLLGSFSSNVEKKNNRANDTPTASQKPRVVLEEGVKVHALPAEHVEPQKPSVLLTSAPTKGISPNTAFMVAIGLLSVVFLIMIIDSRNRINRLESMLFSFLSQKHAV